MTIGTQGVYGVGHYVAPTGFFRQDSGPILIKKCNTCGNWLPETSQFFYHDGKSNKAQGWRSEGYCKECRSLKEAMARSAHEATQNRGGNIQRLRQEFESGKRKATPLKGLTVLVAFERGVEFEKNVQKRDKAAQDLFVKTTAAMVHAATENNSEIALQWIAAHHGTVEAAKAQISG